MSMPAPSSEQPSSHSTELAAAAAKSVGARRNGLVARLAALLVAGLLTWLFVQALHPVFWTEVGRDEVGFLPLDVQWRLDRNNTMLVLALLGGLSGMGLVIGERVGRDSWKDILITAAKCGTVGAVFGALAGYLGHRTFEFYKTNAEVSDLGKAVRVNAVMLATLGGGVGLGAGWFLGPSTRAAIDGLVRGLLAGVLASLIYPFLVAATMPGAMTTVLLPLEVAERLLWFCLATGLLGALLPFPPRAPVGDGSA